MSRVVTSNARTNPAENDQLGNFCSSKSFTSEDDAESVYLTLSRCEHAM